MDKKAKTLLAYILFSAFAIGIIIFLTNAVIAFATGNSDLKINYNLITADIVGRHYTPTCFGTCDLVFSLIYSGVNAPTSVAIDTNKLRTQFNWAKGQEDIGQVRVKESGEAEISLEKKGESFSPRTSITGEAIEDIKHKILNKDNLIILVLVFNTIIIYLIITTKKKV